MKIHTVPLWKKAPFIRLLAPVIAGILLQWYFQFSIASILIFLTCFSLALFTYSRLPLAFRFKTKVVQGFILHLILIAFGLFITYQKDIRHDKNWFGNFYHDSDYIVATINEPLIEKNKSYKAIFDTIEKIRDIA